MCKDEKIVAIFARIGRHSYLFVGIQIMPTIKVAILARIGRVRHSGDSYKKAAEERERKTNVAILARIG